MADKSDAAPVYWRLLRSPVLTILLVGALIAFALLWKRGGGGGTEREAYAYLASEGALASRARGGAGAPACPPEAGDVCVALEASAVALAEGERWDLYWASAASPLAVSIDSWSEDHPRGDETPIALTLINDTEAEQIADVRVSAVDRDGGVVASSRMQRVNVPAASRMPLSLQVRIPNSGPYLLAAELRPRDPQLTTVWSRRKIGFGGAGASIPDPPFRSSCCSGSG